MSDTCSGCYTEALIESPRYESSMTLCDDVCVLLSVQRDLASVVLQIGCVRDIHSRRSPSRTATWSLFHPRQSSDVVLILLRILHCQARSE